MDNREALIHQAVKALIRSMIFDVHDLAKTRSLIETNQHLLLTNEAELYLMWLQETGGDAECFVIAQQAQQRYGIFVPVERLTVGPLGFIKMIREKGFDIAWATYEMTLNKNEILAATDAFLDAITLDQKYQAFVAHQRYLLSDGCFMSLRRAISAYQSGELTPPQAGNELARMLALFEDARTHGIALAWEKYKRMA